MSFTRLCPQCSVSVNVKKAMWLCLHLHKLCLHYNEQERHCKRLCLDPEMARDSIDCGHVILFYYGHNFVNAGEVCTLVLVHSTRCSSFRLDELDSEGASLRLRQQLLEQEKTLVRNQNNWLSRELQEKSEEVLRLRKEKTSMVAQLESKVAMKDQEVSGSSELFPCTVSPSLLPSLFPSLPPSPLDNRLTAFPSNLHHGGTEKDEL